MATSQTEVQALDRVADAIHALAKAQRAQVKVAERSVQLQTELFELQKTNLAVSKALESRLLMQEGEQNGKI